MGQDIQLRAADGTTLSAYRSDPIGRCRGAIVVVQEIFGVNRHIRSICDRLANEGYVAIAPSIFDRIQPNFQSGYSPDEVASARKFVANPDWGKMLLDTQAAINRVRTIGPVGIMGFCLGGSIAFASAVNLSGLRAAVGFYGSAISRFAEDEPRIPTQLHFGEFDASIPLSDVEAIREKRPEVDIYVYPSVHGFCNDDRESFHKASADLAWSRSTEFMAKHLTAAERLISNPW